MTKRMIGLVKQHQGLYYFIAMASHKPMATTALSTHSHSSQVPFTDLWYVGWVIYPFPDWILCPKAC